MHSPKRFLLLSTLTVGLACLLTTDGMAEDVNLLFPRVWQSQSNQCIAYSTPTGRIELRDLSLATDCAFNLPMGATGGIYIDDLSVGLSLSTDGGMTWTPVTTPGSASVKVVSEILPAPNYLGWNMEFERLNLDSGAIPGGFGIRENASLASTGYAQLIGGPGAWGTSSFVDLFTEITVDGGAHWIRATEVSLNGGVDWTTGGSMHMIGVPEPGTMTHFVAGLAVVLGVVRLRRNVFVFP